MKVVFHNPYTSYTGESKSPGLFRVDAFVEVVEDIVVPAGDESLYVGVPVRVEWTDYFGTESDSTIAQVDMSLTPDGGVSWVTIGKDVTYDQDPVTGYNYASFEPTDQMVSAEARLRLTYFSGGGNVASDTSNVFTVYPVDGVFADVSDSAGVDYDGLPYAAVTIDYDSDEMPDLFVSIQACDGCYEPESKLYQNQAASGGAIDYLDRTSTKFASGSEPRYETLGAAVADYDDDGDDDFFVAHASAPQFFRYASNVFTDVATNTSVFPAAVQDSLAMSYCASWVDYDHDGDVDLYVGRADYDNGTGGSKDQSEKMAPWPDAVFENASGSFSEVGVASGLVNREASEAGATLSVVWADFEDDGKWEVIVGDYEDGTPKTKLFEEVGTGDYVENEDAFPGGFSGSSVSGLQVLDFDQDNDLDVVVSRAAQTSYVLANASADTLADFGSLVELPGAAGWEAAGCAVIDYNLDGLPDILLPNRLDAAELQLWANLNGHDGFETDFVDIGTAVGLADSSGAAQGALGADLNGDGDPDLVLGRLAATGRVFKNTRPDGTDLPDNHWIAFKLVPGNEDNGSAIGTIVTLTDDGGTEPLGIQIVDGGSGRGGQLPRLPIFGLGDLDETVRVTVRWPAGRTMVFTVTPEDFDSIVEVHQTSSLNIDDASVSFVGEVIPETNDIDWIFTWETDYWSDVELDQVYVEKTSGGTCVDLGDGWLEYGEQNVTCSITYQVDPVTSEISFKHELRWSPGDCVVNCTYHYRVHSDNGVTADQSPATTWKNISFKVCPSN